MGGAAYRSGAAITPHDSTDIAGGVVNAIYVGGAGNLVVVDQTNVAYTLTGVLVGQVYPVVARRVNATGTTATNLVGLRH